MRQALDNTAEAVRPGITTEELDEIGARVLAQNGAESAPPKVYGFPGALCISVNEEAIHGIPGERVIQSGDLVKLDLVAEKDGFYADAAVTVRAGEVSVTADALARCAASELSIRPYDLPARETACMRLAAWWSARPSVADFK